MDRTDYILRMLAKPSKKRWEHYAINRIYHRLDDPDLELICQQCIRSAKRGIYLVDLFFPQLGLYLEIDEGHHESDDAKVEDAKRRFDIAEVSDLDEARIGASGIGLEEFDARIDEFVERVRRSKSDLLAEGRFTPWDYEVRYTSKPHIDAGYMEIGPSAAFRTHRDALECFGYRKGHYQRGVWDIPEEVSSALGLKGKSMVWFPHLYEHPDWENSISPDRLTVTEKSKDPDHSYPEPWDTRVIMARSRDEYNRLLYRFVGVFEVIPEYRSGNVHKFERIATRVKAYQG